jgi:ComF family protein
MCVKCGYPFEYDMGENALCGECLSEKHKFDKARYALVYNEKVAEFISKFKYSDGTHNANFFADIMIKSAGDIIDEADIICSVPLHPKKLFSRKYNQSAILANNIARKVDISCDNFLIKRKKNNPPQASLSKIKRLKNIKGNFSIPEKSKGKIIGKNILLIDDVMTTGATINECCKMLKKSGAGKIFVLTIAKSLGK